MKNNIKAKAIFSSEDFKVINVSGESGDTLEKHKVNENGLLLVKKGSITYKEGDLQTIVSEGEGQHIPANVFHEVSCNEAAEVFVIIPQQSKMKFAR